MLVVARIQAHPSRRDLHQRLVDSLGLPAEVIEHESSPPSPWAGYQLCLGSALADQSEWTHALVIQDDAKVSINFTPAVQQIAERHPDVPVCLFLGGYPQGAASRVRRAMLKGKRYIPLYPSPIVPLVAVLWPRHKAKEFLDWATSGVPLPGDPTPRADDGIAARWVKQTKQEVVVTAPSIVQHLDKLPSVKGGQPAGWGKDKQRVAAVFAEDASQFNWS